MARYIRLKQQQNCTITYNNAGDFPINLETHTTLATAVQVNFTPNNGYEFTNGNYYTEIGTSKQTTWTNVNSDGVLILRLYSADQTRPDIYLTAIATEKAATYVTLTKTLENCACDTIQIKTSITEQQSIIVTANSGYKFADVNAVTLNIFDNRGSIVDTSKALSANDTVCTITFSLSPNSKYSSANLTATAIQSTVLVNEYPFINVYIPTNDNLKALANVRFYDTQNGIVDLGNYIVSLLKMFVPLPTGDNANIKLYNHDTQISVPVALGQKVVTDCGNVAITGMYNNSVDYTNSKLTAYLPFYGSADLETDKYIGKTVNLSYITDILTGDSMAIFTEAANGLALDSFNCNVSIAIPYTISNYATLNYRGDVNTNSKALLDRVPYIMLEYPKSIDNVPIKSNSRYGAVSDYKGFTRFENVTINFAIPDNEIEEIKNLLEAGVIL